MNGFSEAMGAFGSAAGKLAAEMQRMTAAVTANATAMNDYFSAVDVVRAMQASRSAWYRRAVLEQKLGYRLPDWVWNVEEQKRRTEGSGNGRVMRE